MNTKYGLFHNFINRELSWLEFNDRVIEEAYDHDNPLFERLKFLAISSSNLDEFFMVRVASLWDQVAAGFHKKDPAGLNPKEQVEEISERAHKMVMDQYNCYNRSLLMALRKENVFFLKNKQLTKNHKEFIENYFQKNIYPVLTPMVVDKSRPFPLILNKTLNIAVLLENTQKKEEDIFATVQVPSVLNRFIEIPSEKEERCFVLLEDIIKMNIHTLFIGHHILDMACYRITRNGDLGLDEEGAEDLLEAIEQSIKQRKRGACIRLEIEQGMDKRLTEILETELEVPSQGIYEIKGPLDLTFLMKFSSMGEFDYLKFDPIKPQPSMEFKEEEDIFKAIAKKDILIHQPYTSFDPVVELVKTAAKDPQVLAIKQTLYRVSGNSPIVNALAEAAENGKQVTVLVELKARFDEENNIIWAKRLEKAGCHVIYGLVGLKTHCKVLLVVRREEEGIKRYVHMGTGNYNDVTAKIYTDLSLFTANPYFGADASALFNMLSGYSQLITMYKTDIAPLHLRSKFLSLIRQEADHARQGKKAKIIAKMNSLVDKEIVEALYDASNAGVEIELIVRGICCLRPGIPGVSEKITVRSIVGRFLEHSRIFYFYNEGDELMYLSSADWMNRNLDRRVELLFPIEDKMLREKVKDILDICLSDTMKARILDPQGKYNRIDRRGKEALNSQEYFYSLAIAETKNKGEQEVQKEFKPTSVY